MTQINSPQDAEDRIREFTSEFAEGEFDEITQYSQISDRYYIIFTTDTNTVYSITLTERGNILSLS